MSDSDGPPPLVDSSSDEAEDGCRRYRNRPAPSHTSTETRRSASEEASDSNDAGNDAAPPPPPQDQSPPSPITPPGVSRQREAAEFCLSRMKQCANLQV